jgi:gamma-glutamylcysteine synthetase
MTPPAHDEYWKLYAHLLELRTKGLRNRLQRYRQGTDRITPRAYKQLTEILSGKTIPATALLEVTLDDFLDDKDELDFNALLWWIDQEAQP